MRLADIQSSRGLIDKAIEVNMSALKFCKDRDQDCKADLEAQKAKLIEMKLKQSIERIEKGFHVVFNNTCNCLEKNLHFLQHKQDFCNLHHSLKESFLFILLAASSLGPPLGKSDEENSLNQSALKQAISGAATINKQSNINKSSSKSNSNSKSRETNAERSVNVQNRFSCFCFSKF